MRLFNLIILLTGFAGFAHASTSNVGSNVGSTVDNSKNTKVLAQMATPEDAQKMLTRDAQIAINGEKVTMKATLDDSSGNVCVDVHVRWDSLKAYSPELWTSRLEINGRAEKAELRATPLQLLGSSDNSSSIAAEMMIHGCTKSKFQNINKVSYIFKDNRNKPVARFDWAKPMPVTQKTTSL